MTRRPLHLLLVALSLVSGCSIRKLAVGSLADGLSAGGDTFAKDDDPQLVREAIPFALKTYESLLEEVPSHRALLVATGRGFAQYAYGFLRADAERLEDRDLRASLELRRRARRLLLRGRDYCLRALELDHPGLTADLMVGDAGRLAEVPRDRIDALYWMAASWGAAISILKDDAELIGDLPVVEAALIRVIELDETYDRGAAHEVMMALEAGLAGGSLDRAKEHYLRAVELSDGAAASPYVAYAETIAVTQQDRVAFLEMLDRAQAVDLDAAPTLRLANVLSQGRAAWLRSRVEELFFE